jgi:hypothetical protein
MSEPSEPLRPADPDDVIDALSYALRYDGRSRVRHADIIMARIVADRMVRQLAVRGYVVMKREGDEMPSTPGMPPPIT